MLFCSKRTLSVKSELTKHFLTVDCYYGVRQPSVYCLSELRQEI
ncbi:hypothetical protein T03_9813 [Trichinella britovi]|uniref:Uncharacterized protein n=1 Tax=Trichinella britovi TaxID=45882 RepID=A0A0V1C4D2_TRIBR|nr:hypothetical protein T03_9813 [Trichinella britovi]